MPSVFHHTRSSLFKDSCVCEFTSRLSCSLSYLLIHGEFAFERTMTITIQGAFCLCFLSFGVRFVRLIHGTGFCHRPFIFMDE